MVARKELPTRVVDSKLEALELVHAGLILFRCLEAPRKVWAEIFHDHRFKDMK